MNFLVAAVVVCALASPCATQSVEWCFHLPTCNDATWPVLVPEHCNGTRQSPINIVTADVQPDATLTEFTFVNFDSPTAMKTIKNTGKTVKVSFQSGVQVSGGGLPEAYNSLQFHLHWGNGSSIPGSEHTVDGKRYPMELHIVNIKSSHMVNPRQSLADPTGLAALGFFIEEIPDEVGEPESWANLTSYLASIPNKDDSVAMAPGFSLEDLLEDVDFSQYYRYHGSLTTPPCYEAVVWTVFKQPIRVSRELIDLFSTTVHITDSSSPFVTDVYRNVQPAQPVTSQPVHCAAEEE